MPNNLKPRDKKSPQKKNEKKMFKVSKEEFRVVYIVRAGQMGHWPRRCMPHVKRLNYGPKSNEVSQFKAVKEFGEETVE